tara:strand:- start:3899 stop:4063 length:165 start_codon:yes stop_codon:yes gene_type:complete
MCKSATCLNVEAGDLVTSQDTKFPSGWILVQNNKDPVGIGYVPNSYLEFVKILE